MAVLRARLKDAMFRDGYDELPAPIPNRRKLGSYLRLQIPGQHQHVVRLICEDRFRRPDRYMRSWQEQTLLSRAEVNSVGYQLRTNPTVVEKRVTLRGRTIAYDGFSGTPGVDQETQEIAFYAGRPLGKATVGVKPIEPVIPFSGPKAGNAALAEWVTNKRIEPPWVESSSTS